MEKNQFYTVTVCVTANVDKIAETRNEKGGV